MCSLKSAARSRRGVCKSHTRKRGRARSSAHKSCAETCRRCLQNAPVSNPNPAITGIRMHFDVGRHYQDGLATNPAAPYIIPFTHSDLTTACSQPAGRRTPRTTPSMPTVWRAAERRSSKPRAFLGPITTIPVSFQRIEAWSATKPDTASCETKGSTIPQHRSSTKATAGPIHIPVRGDSTVIARTSSTMPCSHTHWVCNGSTIQTQSRMKALPMPTAIRATVFRQRRFPSVCQEPGMGEAAAAAT